MKNLSMKYGSGLVNLPVKGEKWVKTLGASGPAPIGDIPAALLEALERPVDCPPLRFLIGPRDPVTIVISDITRLWMRQDIIVPHLINYLVGLGVPYENITVLVALGTHRPQTEEELQRLVPPAFYRLVKVVNHDCMGELVDLGSTSRGTRVRVNPLVVGRKVILVGGTVHHLMAGFGGGRKSIVPGVSGKETINQNHIHALDPAAPRSNPAIGLGVLQNNPIHEDMTEACAMVNPVFGINLVVDAASRHIGIIGGHWQNAWLQSCQLVRQSAGVPIQEQADVVVASCGGYPKDISLYQAVKTLLNAAQAVKPGGTVVFLAECREGGGAEEFFGWISSLQKGTLDADLRADFSIAGYIFYAACEVVRRCRVLMLSKINTQTLADMQIQGFRTIETLLAQVDFTDKTVYAMPDGGATVPYLAGG